MSKHKSARYAALVAFFLAACIIFAARLVNFQIFSRDKYAPAGGDGQVERIYIDAVRGSICDRNGKVLVRDNRIYTFVLDYDTIPETRSELNDVLLIALEAMDKAAEGSTYAESLNPFKGTYPNFEFSDDFTSNRKKYDEFIRLIEKNYVTDSFTLEDAMATLSATEVARYYARRYELVREIKTEDGSFKYESRFTDEQITRLIGLRYEMERLEFGGAKDFVFISDATYDFNVYIRELAVDGLKIEEVVSREYLYPGYASHILGLTGKIYAEDWEEYKAQGYDINDTVGISGCEAIFESYLRGQDGIVDVYRDADGKVIRREVVKQAVSGKDVWLTIDIDLQITAEDSLAENIRDIVESATSAQRGEDAASGAVVAVDPSNGELLTLASYPTFDLSTYHEDIEELLKNEDSPLLNRGLQTTLAPGSTFKVGMALAALEEGIYSSSTNMICNGYYDRYGSANAYKCAVHPLGVATSLNVSEAIRISCNCFFFETGHYLGIDRMNAWCKLFGFGQSTGIELSEKTGILAGAAYRDANPEFCIQTGLGAWQAGDTWNAAIGQAENSFTPLQVAIYTATIANGGTRYGASLLHSVREFGSGEVLVGRKTEVLSSVEISTKNLNIVKAAMERVVSEDYGTIGLNFRGVKYSIAAKTGTAQANSNESDNAWFTGFAPVDNPKIAVTCLIENGASGSYASYTVRKVMDKYLVG